jgi:hypothetical protein
MRSRCCLCHPINFSMPEPIFMKLDTYIMAPQLISTAYPIVARQRLGRNVTAVTNTRATIQELLDASFSMWPVSYQGK